MLSESVGRVVARDLIVPYTVPPAPLAAMDGYAVISKTTEAAMDQHPVTLSDAVRVNTGNVMPDSADAVIMIEDVWEDEKGEIAIRKAAHPMQHVRPAGEDVTAGQLVVTAGHCIRPFDIGALATYGYTTVPVRDVSIGLIPSGSELIPAGTHPKPGQVVESNMLMTAAFLTSLGLTPVIYPFTPDDPDAIRNAIENAVQTNDMVIISAGSSAGTRDFSAQVIHECGDVLFHGVAIKPGKPLICGRIQNKPIIGMPGYPLSAVVILQKLITPLLSAWGFYVPHNPSVTVTLAERLASDGGIDEFVFLAVGKISGQYIAVSLSRGAGVQMAALTADAWLHIPSDIEGYSEGTVVQAVSMFRDPVIDTTILVAGCADPIIRVLDSMIRQKQCIIRVRNTGEVSGLIALSKPVCHMTALRYDPTVDSVNAVVKKRLPHIPVHSVPVADIVYGIAGTKEYTINDIPGIRFVCREEGSPEQLLCTRILTESGLISQKEEIQNYPCANEISILSAIQNNTADAGFCSEYSARYADLSFTPLGNLRYELVYRADQEPETVVKQVIAMLTSEAWRERVTSTTGYLPV